MSNKLQGSIVVFIGACSFGVLSTFVKLAYGEGFTQNDIVGTQVFIGVIVLTAINLLRCKKTTTNPTTTTTPIWKVILAGSSTGLVSVTYYYCVQLVDASLAIILLMQFIWMSMLIESIVFNVKPNKAQIIAAIMVLIGTCFASGLFTTTISELPLKGIAFGLLAAFTYSISVLVNGRVGNDLSPIKKSNLMVIGACIMVFIVFPPSFFTSGILGQGLLKWSILLALFGMIIPPFLFAWGIPKAGVNLSAILSSAELPVAVCMSYFILHETVDFWRWFGVAIILAAIIAPNILKGKEKED